MDIKSLTEAEAEAEDALQELIDIEEEIVEAQRDVVIAKEKKEAILGLKSNESNEKTATQRENWARNTVEYKGAVQHYANAMGEAARLRQRQEIIKMKLSLFQTKSANQRITI